MSEENVSETPEESVRTETFPVTGPLEIDVNVTIGKVEIRLDAVGESAEAQVEVRRDTTDKPPWVGGMTTMLNWVTERFGNQFGTDWDVSPADAVRQARIEQVGNRLVVQASTVGTLRMGLVRVGAVLTGVLVAVGLARQFQEPPAQPCGHRGGAGP